MKFADVTPDLSVIGTKLNFLTSDRFKPQTIRTASDVTKQPDDEIVTVENVNGTCKREVPGNDIIPVRAYKRRYWMLFLFLISNIHNGIFTSMHTSIADITSCYYGVSLEAVNWTVTTFMCVYIIFTIPGYWLMQRIGLRKTILLASLFNVLCSAILFGALDSNGFPVLMISVIMSSISMLFLLPVPPLLAAVWFPGEQVSRACTVGAMGNQLGTALGYLFPSQVVSDDCSNKLLIRKGKEILACSYTAATVMIFVLVIFTFQNNPKMPPSIAELRKKENVKISYKESIMKMFKNRNFVLLMLTAGFVIGTYFTIGSILNTLMFTYFPKQDVAIGWMGLIFIFVPSFTSFLVGYMLDTYKKFKETSMGFCIASCLSYLLFAGLMETKVLWVQFITIAILGCFLTGFYAVTFEYGVEIIYPESEILSAALLNCSALISIKSIFKYFVIY